MINYLNFETVFPVIACGALLGAMIVFAGLFAKFLDVPPIDATNRLLSLDGLRGFLAVFVFFHHSYIWFYYLKSGDWRSPESHIFTHFGQSSVELFFMITAFLFFGKLFNSSSLDWVGLFRARIYRLAPAYWFAVALIMMTVVLTGYVSPVEIITKYFLQSLRWILFTLPGSPNIGFHDTALIVAKVTWSLRYEWLFYMSLPFFFLILGGKIAKFWAIFGFVGFLGLLWVALRDNWWHLLYFCGGGMVAYIKKNHRSVGEIWRRSAQASFVCLVGLIIAVISFRGAHNIFSFLTLLFVFWCVTGGNSLWGVLCLRGVRVLGEMSYSIYLLHGFVLFIVFYAILGIDQAGSFSLLRHWLVIALCSPFVILIAAFSCKFFELPFIGLGKAKVP